MSEENKIIPFDGCSDGIEQPAPKKIRFQKSTAMEFAIVSKTDWLIKGILPKAELACIYGESGSGKSFLALDMVMAIARGSEWIGHKTAKGRVVYIAAEGASGFRKRLVAYSQHNNLSLKDVENFFIIPECPNLMSTKDIEDLTKAIDKAEIIVIDTFARTIVGGNENSGEDVGVAIAACQTLRDKTGAVVMLVHHAGKDQTRGMRGWSGLKAAVDTEIEVLRFDEARKVKITKQKDGDEGQEWGFALKPIVIGTDDDGDEITSCVVITEGVDLPKRPKSTGYMQKIIMECFTGGNKFSIETDELIGKVMQRLPQNPDAKRDTRKQQILQCVQRMAKENILQIKDGKVLKN